VFDGHAQPAARGVYRPTAQAPGTTRRLAVELWPTASALAAGDRLKLELTGAGAQPQETREVSPPRQRNR
jgi:predicted acyl esterase